MPRSASGRLYIRLYIRLIRLTAHQRQACTEPIGRQVEQQDIFLGTLNKGSKKTREREREREKERDSKRNDSKRKRGFSRP